METTKSNYSIADLKYFKVNSHVMLNEVERGDFIGIDTKAKIENGNIVIAELKDGRSFIKKYKEVDNNTILLYSDSPILENTTVSKIDLESINRVVSVMKEV